MKKNYEDLKIEMLENVKNGLVSKYSLEERFNLLDEKIEKYRKDSNIDKELFAEWEREMWLLDDVLYEI